ncbi:MAG: histidine phosphatase family protein [Oceanicoccus sp.]|uniref:histidine phosphatase family protein n=1 Tax=Oceanicoccus sp. TaxID=2691044 RepID=UPI002616D56B|nr:histidine phosphatase family protein [Oceanicoccus sp.]MCP3906616.1 histidine phosphatase family protein [Oceanicoccus sp.]MDG1773124.1 histidine phosphatase family protein [Oceanicoccus sp.]
MTITDFQTTTIDILRHGQTVADDILRGRIDVPLSDNGYQQMQDRLNPLIDPSAPWQQIITSPLQRCAAFADDINQQHGTPVTINEGFLEMDFGDWDGKSFEELKANDPVLFSKIWRQPHRYSPPNGEPFTDFSARIGSAWEGLIKQHGGKHILLICHGGVIRALLGHIMETPLTALSRIEVPYACLSRVKVHHQQGKDHWPQLIFHNVHQ